MPASPASRPPAAAIAIAIAIAIACCVAAAPPARAADPPVPSGAAAGALPAGIEVCAQVRVDAERLACYDRFVAPRVKGAAEGAAVPAANAVPASAAGAAAAAVAATGKPPPSVDDGGRFLDEYWELSPERKRGTFNFDGYRPNYFLPIHVSSRVNRDAASPAEGHSGRLPDYRRYETKLQLSVRTKLWEDVGVPGGDLWFGYTQQSLWQLYSGDISRPFRATDHEPELFYVAPIRYELPLGIRLQMAGVGVAHQSNGLTRPFSRSWNRTWAMLGLERGQFALTARQNWRMHERDGNDDNPDLTDYRGRTELPGAWTPGSMTATALWKTNFDKRGSLQVDWTMPVRKRDPKGLRWYVQVFTGYGESLIEYNFRQTSVGAGLTLFGW